LVACLLVVCYIGDEGVAVNATIEQLVVAEKPIAESVTNQKGVDLDLSYWDLSYWDLSYWDLDYLDLDYLGLDCLDLDYLDLE
jgi:hypothetical protein